MKRLFSDIIGHKAIVKKLLNLTAEKRVPGALLFVGPPGQGKKRVALAWAQALICPKSTDACGECGACLRVASGQSEGLIVVEPAGGAVKIDQTRQVVRQLALRALSQARVVIIDDANTLNPQAGNALLKSIEEPPPNTHFILIAPSEKHVLPTLRSRAQIVRFAQLKRDEFAQVTPAEPFPEIKELAWSVLHEGLSGDVENTLNSVREKVDDREQALWLMRYFQEYVRDAWLVKKSAGQPIHSDREYSQLSEMPEENLGRLGQSFIAGERSLQGFLDVQLTLENLVRQMRGGEYVWSAGRR